VSAVTFSFADPAAGLYGLARLGPPGALAVLYAGGGPVAGFEQLAVQSLEETVDEPLRRWTVRFDEGEHGLDLAFEATGPPAALGPSEPAARAGGMTGSVQVCRVHGTARAGGRAHEVRGLGQRMHTSGEPDWGRIGSARTLGVWLVDGTGIAAVAVRPATSSHHEDEATWAALLSAAGTLQVDEPRLSTTYDEAGRQRRANLELWVGAEDSYPRRATGEAVCGSTLDLGELRLDCAFMRWRMDGRSGMGRYDVLRPT
jgi:peptidoglycan hydrolase-like protein with peptidoglycan-binding domain